MAAEKDNNQNEQKKRSFVREHIVPRKNTKKILLTILSTIGLALLFGAIAGVAFFVSQDILDGNNATDAPPVVTISRDESRPDNSGAFFPGSQTIIPDRTEHVPATDATESQPEPSGEVTDTEPGGTTPEPASETPSASKESDPAETDVPSGETDLPGSSESQDPSESTDAPPESETETGDETEIETAAPTLLDVYKKIRTGFLGVTISTPVSRDIFGNLVYDTKNGFGTVIAETDDDYYALFDGSGMTSDSVVTAYVDGMILDAEHIGTDVLTGLGMLRIRKNEQASALTVIPLGNSNLVLAADEVYQFGYQMGDFIAMDQGVVSYISAYENFIDGYRMMIYTGMQRREGTFSILVNQSGEIIGFVGDKISANGTMAVARGVSGIKYLIDDLCATRDTAYIGLQGRAVGEEEAASYGRPVGFYIQFLDENGPAARSGLQPGDRIISLNGQTVSHSFGLQLLIDEIDPGSEVRVQIARLGGDGSEMILLYRFMADAR